MASVVDVIVLGSGAAGLSAALTCRAAGLSVTVLEKTEFFGGSTAVSGGAVWIPDNPLMATVGLSDSRDAAVAYLQRTVGNHLRADMIDAFLTHGPNMVNFLETNTEVHFAARKISPDYKPELEGAATGGRTIDPLPFDGRRLGNMFDALRLPIKTFLVFGGMMVNTRDINALLSLHKNWASFRHATGLLARFAKDRLRWRRGTRLLLGNALAGRLLKSALDAGISLRRNIVISQLIEEGGRVCGVWLEENGARSQLRATHAVVLATGGFAQSVAMRDRLVPHAQVHRSMAPAGNTGDGVALAEPLGGRMETDNADPVFWAPVSIMTDADGKETVFPHLVTDRQKPGIMAVNAAGRRFVNEATSYHDFVVGMHRSHAEMSCIPAWLICDAKFLSRYGMGLVRPHTPLLNRYIESGYLKRALSVTALAQLIGVPDAALEESVARMNTAAQTGIDPEFSRGASAYDRYLGDPQHRPNPCLGPIATAPFYAVQIWPGDIGSAAGLKTDASARVLDGQGAAIPGLFACGNDMNSIMAGTYPAAGITLGPALTFGYIAGQTIVHEGAAT
jgi:succinate dehydrogenase/fumarate reductase flavoprotein subunit